eukprot:11193811-Lingulodinium_polyedra.AAC.1
MHKPCTIHAQAMQKCSGILHCTADSKHHAAMLGAICETAHGAKHVGMMFAICCAMWHANANLKPFLTMFSSELAQT